MFRVLAGRRPVESSVQGPSMGATLPDGTRVRIRPFPEGTAPRAGQVVAFVAGARVLLHRVAYVARRRKHLITQGDGNWLCDPPIAVEAVAGVVEEAHLDGAWCSVAAAPRALPRRLAAGLSLALLAPVLEASPAAAARIARAMSYARMSARWLWARVGPARLPTGGR